MLKYFKLEQYFLSSDSVDRVERIVITMLFLTPILTINARDHHVIWVKDHDDRKMRLTNIMWARRVSYRGNVFVFNRRRRRSDDETQHDSLDT